MAPPAFDHPAPVSLQRRTASLWPVRDGSAALCRRPRTAPSARMTSPLVARMAGSQEEQPTGAPGRRPDFASRAAALLAASLLALPAVSLAVPPHVSAAPLAAPAAPTLSTAPAPAPGRFPAPAAPLNEQGARLFENTCAACHAGGGNVISFARNKTLKKKALVKYGYDTPAAIADLLRNGKGVMPAYAQDRLSDQDINDISEFVLQAAAKNWK